MRRSYSHLTAIAVVSGLAVLSGAAARQAQAADAAPQIMFIVDGSGSMWGRLDADRRAKIDIVRELLKSKIEAAGTQPIGLTSFGHRRKGDCSDVEVIAAPSAAHDQVLEQLEKLNPRGKGPLVAALRQAAAAVSKGPASVIVINDNADNCQQDACAAAAEIAAVAPGVPIHMIGVGVDVTEVPRLQCVSTATGGTFYDVKDSAGLAAAIDAATKLAMLAPGTKSAPTPGANAPPAPTASNASLQATVALAQGGAPIAAPVHWRILKSNTAEPVAESIGPSITPLLDTGSYDIEAELGRMHVKQTVAIEAGHPASIILPLNAGRLKITAKSDKSALLQAPQFITIEPVIDNKAQPDLTTIEHEAQTTHILPAGNYNVSVADGALRQTKTIGLAAGADTTLEFALGTGRIELSAGLREDGGAIEDVTYIVSEDDPDSPDGRHEVARSRAPIASFILQPGTYYVSARSGDGEVRQRIAVGPGDLIKRALILPLVPVKVSALIGGQPATANQGLVYSITALDGERREITRSVMPDLSLSLMPGRYRIAAELDAHHLKAADEVNVEAGKSLAVVLKFDAGEISLKTGDTSAGASSDAFWEITDSKGKPVWHSMSADAKALLAPGRYIVHLEVRDKRTEAAFEVISGERKVVQIGQN